MFLEIMPENALLPLWVAAFRIETGPAPPINTSGTKIA